MDNLIECELLAVAFIREFCFLNPFLRAKTSKLQFLLV